MTLEWKNLLFERNSQYYLEWQFYVTSKKQSLAVKSSFIVKLVSSMVIIFGWKETHKTNIYCSQCVIKLDRLEHCHRYTIYFRGIFRSPPAAKRKSANYTSNYELNHMWPLLKCNFWWLLPSKSIFDPFRWPGAVRKHLDPDISYK